MMFDFSLILCLVAHFLKQNAAPHSATLIPKQALPPVATSAEETFWPLGDGTDETWIWLI